ncbi:MAG TPA: nucleotidyl transferase [Methanoculleus sp.]|nr:nucleotidyl transferase [Methanoculleus sp.]
MMQAVILAGGEGSRMRPLTKNRPKAMIPVGGKPILGYVIESVVAAGIRDIVVVAGYRKEQVIRYLDTFDLEITVVIQKHQLGVLDALSSALGVIRDEFIVLPGDNYVDAASIRKVACEPRSILVTPHPEPSNLGVVTVADGLVRRIEEKPGHPESSLVSTGVLHLDPSIYPYFGDGELPDAVNAAIEAGIPFRPVWAEKWDDAVYPWHLLKLNQKILHSVEGSIEGTVSQDAVITGQVKIGRNTTIHPGVVITGPVVIGENCDVGPNVVIDAHTSIGSGGRISPFSHIGGTLVMDDVHVGPYSSLQRAVIGEGVELSSHTAILPVKSVVDSGEDLLRAKFGAVIGDRSSSAPFTHYAGAIVGSDVRVGTGQKIEGTIPDGTMVR